MNRLFSGGLLLAGLLHFESALAYDVGQWNVHGTVSQGWIHSHDNNFIEDSTSGTFDFREFGINATTSVGENVTVGGQLFGRKFGVVGDDEVYLDWLGVTYSYSNEFGVRAGKLKMPYGLYGETRDIDSLRTQILLPQGVYSESYRGAINSMWGGAVFGNIYSDRWGSLAYSVQLGEADIDQDNGEMNRLASYVGLVADDVGDGEAGAIKLLWDTPARGLRVGATFSWSEFSVTGPAGGFLGLGGNIHLESTDQYFFVASADYSWERITVTLETLLAQLDADISTDFAAIPPVAFSIELSGVSLSAQYRATERFTLGVGYSGLVTDQQAAIGPGIEIGDKLEQDGVYLSLRYDFTPNLILKLEQHVSTGEAALFPLENPDGLEDDWSMTLVKISFVF